jgi:hypothetical protein
MGEEDIGDSEDELTILVIAVFQKRQYDNKMGPTLKRTIEKKRRT